MTVTVDERECDELCIVIDGVPITMHPREWWERSCLNSSHSGASPLTPSDVYNMRVRYHEKNRPASALARRYDRSKREIYRIVWGESFPHVPMPAKLRPRTSARSEAP